MILMLTSHFFQIPYKNRLQASKKNYENKNSFFWGTDKLFSRSEFELG